MFNVEVSGMNVKRFNICLTPELDKRLDEVSKLKKVSRSQIISTALTEYLNALDLIPDVKAQLNELTSLLDELGNVKKQ